MSYLFFCPWTDTVFSIYMSIFPQKSFNNIYLSSKKKKGEKSFIDFATLSRKWHIPWGIMGKLVAGSISFSSGQSNNSDILFEQTRFCLSCVSLLWNDKLKSIPFAKASSLTNAFLLFFCKCSEKDGIVWHVQFLLAASIFNPSINLLIYRSILSVVYEDKILYGISSSNEKLIVMRRTA